MNVYEIFKEVSWISVPESEYQRLNHYRNSIDTAYFRKEFTLGKRGKSIINISANSRYRLWINGMDILSGPLKGDNFNRYFETIDISQYLQIGKNVISVKVISYMPPEYNKDNNKGPDWLVANAAGPCLIIAGKILDANNDTILDISTGLSEYKTTLDDAISWEFTPISHWLGSMEVVDDSKIPSNWNQLGNIDDNIWQDAIIKWEVEEDKWGIIPHLPLTERSVKLLYEERKEFINSSSIMIDKNTYKEIVLDAGLFTTGYFNMPLNFGKGSKISIQYSECYVKIEDDGSKLKYRRDDNSLSLYGHRDIYYPSGNNTIYQPFYFRTFRYIKLMIQTKDEVLLIDKPYYIDTGYPLDPTSNISSSESWISDIWDMSINTLQRCMHETYEDCPYFEQLQYIADTRLHMIFTYSVSNDSLLAQKGIYDFHCSMMPNGMLSARYPTQAPHIIPQWSAHWVFMVEDYYWQSGDISFLKRYRATIDMILEYYDRRIGDYGLVENLGYWDQVDWVHEWDRGISPASYIGPSVVQNMVYVNILQSAANINRASSREGVAIEYEEKAEIIYNNAMKHCWSSELNMLREGPDCYEYSQHAQVWAILSDFADDEMANKMMDSLLTYPQIRKCTYPFMFYLVRALEKLNRYDETERIFDEYKEFIDLNLTTLPEKPYSNTRSDCHAWSALPLYEFTHCFLGVRPLKPGWDGIVIKPICNYISDAKGKVTTPVGMVYVDWRIADNNFILNINIPDGIYCEVVLPDESVHLYNSNNATSFTCRI